MKSIHNYNNKLQELLVEAEALDIPHFELRAHKKEVDHYVKQHQCNHSSLEATLQGNVRIWKCTKCNKIIDYETISSTH